MKHFGAIAPGPGDSTEALQAAIEAASAAGGGRVELSEGVHVCRGLRLKSGVDLHLGPGAILRPVPDYDAYRHSSVSVTAEDSDRAMISASGVERVSLTGPGRIEAGGDAFVIGDDEAIGTYVPARHRPRVLVLENCRAVDVAGIFVSQSPMWTLHFAGCEGVTIAGVRIDNDRRMPNTDGIVLDACCDVSVERVDIATADDGIVLKTSAGRDGRAIGHGKRVRVSASRIESRSCALKIGTETHGDIEDVVFEDCEVVRSNRALGVFSRDGGRISNVRFSRIRVDCRETPDGFWGSGEALTVTIADRRQERPAGEIDGLVVEDISGRMEGAMTLVSAARAGIRNVRLSRIALEQEPGALGTALSYDLRPTAADLVLAQGAEGRANAWTRGADGRIVGLENYPGGMPGLYCRGVAGLEIEAVTIRRPAPLPTGWNPEAIVRT